MKQRLLFLVALLTTALPVFARDCCYSSSACNTFGFDSILTFDVGGGYRMDKIEWESLPVYAPNYVVNEKWKNLGMGIVETNAQFLACEHYLFKFDFDWGWFNSNKKQEITTFNIPANRFTQKLEAPTRGHVYNIDGAVGYQFNFFCYRFALTPLVGYSYHFQKLKNRKYENEFDPVENELTFKNSYIYRWRGPTVGVSLAWQIECNWQLFFNYTFHWLRYRGKINEDFVSSTHPAKQKSNNGHGNEFTVGTSYEFCPDWILILKVDYKNFKGRRGQFEEFIFDSGPVTSPLRKLQWESLNATMDVAYVF